MSEIPFDNSYTTLPEHFYRRVEPAKVTGPQLVRFNRELGAELGLKLDSVSESALAGWFSGNVLPDGADPIAQAYAGHQFGGWVPQLGDGRAILLGEVIGSDGVRKDIQLKGAGRTPFSRGGDGKSPLGPAVREYLMSEAMAGLGVPTTRALALVSTEDSVFREEALQGGVFTRVASSHLRVGTFQYFLGQQDTDGLRVLADYAIARHYPECAESETPHRCFLGKVVAAQASLIAHWMTLGFIHGVMNTDNMTISGETIDYGPCAFMDTFDPAKTFSSIDRGGRYAWGNQAAIGHWNLTRLAETMLALFDEGREKAIPIAEEILGTYEEAFKAAYFGRFRKKLGLTASHAESGDFIEDTLSLIADEEADFTLFFRHLTKVAKGESEEKWLGLLSDPPAGAGWLEKWRAFGEPDAALMAAENPVLIPRNHRVEEAILAAYKGDFSLFNRLTEAWRNPFAESSQNDDLEAPPGPGEVVEATFCGT
ncbi:YdiU family protein [Verrucomicrobiales bacterium BCK34]|nr:YdiU family protein [Verrucomicrobiales bacterium BCK34]